jgi:hypothetical protein
LPRRSSAPSGPPPSRVGEPCARGTILVASRLAALKLWGKAGLDEIGARLSDDVRQATIEEIVVATQWLPERHVLEWTEAVWNGPARRRAPELRRWVDTRIDLGFGRVRVLLLKVITPAGLAERGASLWRHDHSTGIWRGATFEGRGVITLSDHPYTTTEVGRLAIAEVFRYLVALVRGPRNVREEHAVDATGVLTVKLAWD